MPGIDWIETGYEDRHDFPPYDGNPRPYLLASVPRAGSTLLSHEMWRTGCLGAPLEYLNFEPRGPYGEFSGSPSAQASEWNRVLRYRTSPNGIFGVKAFPGLMQELGRINPPLLDRAIRFLLAGKGTGKVVQLRRRDRTAHAISYARAQLSGIWRAEQETSDRYEPEYSPDLVQQAERMIAIQEEAWLAMYRDLHIEPLVVWHEDVLDDGRAVIARITAFLDVDLDPEREISVPEIRQQSQRGARDWLARHSSSS